MRSRVFLLISCLFLFSTLQAQVTPPEKKTVHPYRFPVFTPGMIFLRNKDTVPATLNYQFVRNELQFIDELGDTLILHEPLTVAKITIGDEEFYFDKDKWIQKIETASGVILGYWTDVKLESDTRRSGFNGYSQMWPSQWDYTNFALHETDLYFLGDDYGNFTKATKSNLLSFFERKAPRIKQYLNSHSIDFNRLKDIQQVLHFCDTLK